LSRYWLTPEYEEGFDGKVADINDVYKQAIERAKLGQRTESLDEMTSVQALERKHPNLPMRPGKVERREFACAVPQAQVNIFATVHCLLSATSMLLLESWLLVRRARRALKRILPNISNAVWIQSHSQLNGILSATISTFMCPNRWYAMSQKNPISTSTWA
jgi:hypothetical protein